MTNDTRDELAQQALDSVAHFFMNLKNDEKTYLPKCFRTTRTWMAHYAGSVLGIFFLSKAELDRINTYRKKNLPPFPGFIISEDLKPPNDSSAVLVGGTCGYFVSNRTVNMWAFTVKPEASFTVLNHFHEVKDSSTDQEFKFRVDLAFVLGLHQEEQWADLEPRLSELLSYMMKVWKKL